jgi:hypothetical protein
MKAFDKVPHQRLLHKLSMYGIGDIYVNWIRLFLTNRKQKVSVNGESSDWKVVTSGIPQGSVLGPILFVFYINDLPESMQHNSDLYLYADDTKMFKEIRTSDDCEDLQKDIHLMYEWSDKWMLKFHPDKCKTNENWQIKHKLEGIQFKTRNSIDGIFNCRKGCWSHY